MTTPTITSVSPTVLPTRGRVLMRVEGTGFRLPPEPPATGPVPPPPPTMRAWFGSIECRRVRVFSDTLVYLYVPPGGPGDLVLRLDNVDATGATISGETVTYGTALHFKRPDLTKETDVARVTRTLIQWLKREVIETVVLTTHTEYDGTPEDWGSLANVIDLAKLPALILAGPTFEHDRMYSKNEARKVQAADGERILRPSRTVDLTFDITGVTDSQVELMNLANELEDFVNRNIAIVMLQDPTNPGKGLVEYEMQTTDSAKVANRPNESNVRQFSFGLVIRGVDIMVDDMARDISYPVSDLLLGPGQTTPGTGAGGEVVVGDGTTNPVTGGPLPWPVVLTPGVYQLPSDED